VQNSALPLTLRRSQARAAVPLPVNGERGSPAATPQLPLLIFTSEPTSPIRQAAMATYWIVASAVLGASFVEKISHPIRTRPITLIAADFCGLIDAASLARVGGSGAAFPGAVKRGPLRFVTLGLDPRIHAGTMPKCAGKFAHCRLSVTIRE
jgi:hypothetical protein